MENNNQETEICCLKFDPKPWDNQQHIWTNKLFITDSVKTFFYMPLNFGAIMRRLDKKIEEAGVQVPDYLCLSEQKSPWKMNIFLAVDKHISNTQTIALSGKYYSQVFEGPYNDTSKWHKQFRHMLSSKGLNPQQIFTWYTTCPKCAGKYGKNYVVLFARTS